MLWIQEVEMVDSVDELRSSSSTRGISMPNFEVLDARIASALNKIIHNSQFKRRISLEEQKKPRKGTVSFEVDRLPTWSTITFGSLEPMILSKTTPTCSLLFFEMTTFMNSIESGTEFLLSMTKIPPDDILEGLYKFKNTRVWEIKDRIGIVRPGDSSEEVRTWLSQIENDGEEKYRARYTKSEFWRLERELWKKRRGQEWGNKTACTKNSWRLLAMGNQRAVEETIAVSSTISISVVKITPSNPSPNSFMRQNERKPSRTRSPRGKSSSGRTSRWPCKDYLRGTCNNSFCEKWHPPECLYYKTKSGCRFGEKCSFAHRQVDEQPTKRSKSNNDKSCRVIWCKRPRMVMRSMSERSTLLQQISTSVGTRLEGVVGAYSGGNLGTVTYGVI